MPHRLLTLVVFRIPRQPFVSAFYALVGLVGRAFFQALQLLGFHFNTAEEMHLQDLVDCASILEQKEQLKSFWEKKMMGDQSSPANESVVDVPDASRNHKKQEHPQCNGISGDDSSHPTSPVTPTSESCPVKDPPAATPTSVSPESEPVNQNGVDGQIHPDQNTPQEELKEKGSSAEPCTTIAEVEVHVQTASLEISSEQEANKEDEPASVVEEHAIKEEENHANGGECPQLPSTEQPDATETVASDSDISKVAVVAHEEEGIPDGSPALPVEEEVEEDVFSDVPIPEVKRSASPPPTRVPTAPRHVSTVPTTEVPYSNFTTETKIAMEIREMREREEELIQMRERLSKLQIPAHREETKSLSPPHSLNLSPQCNGHTLSKEQNPITRAVSLDSLQAVQQSTTPVFHHSRRKDVTVRPLADDENNDGKPTYKILNESPVEREIKRAAEREEALRKEKGMYPRSGSASTLSKSPTERPTKAKPMSTASYSGNTQRLLATSRIQQEIQEQTQREVALRETGQIQTISEERTDARVARLGELSTEKQPQPQPQKKTRSPTPTALSPTPDSETRTSVGVNGEGTAKLSSPTSSTSSSTSAVPPSRRLYGPSTVGGRGISMQRFIATRGKEVAFVSLGPKNAGPDKTPSPVVEAPVVKKVSSPVQVNGTAVKPLVTSKRALTAESRIQQELMEMKAREEELRQQRVRLFGRSQPDLSTLTNGDKMTNGVDSSEQDSAPSVTSNKKKMEKDQLLKGPRRRHTMIAEWEKIIQSAEGK